MEVLYFNHNWQPKVSDSVRISHLHRCVPFLILINSCKWGNAIIEAYDFLNKVDIVVKYAKFKCCLAIVGVILPSFPNDVY